jgi:hypothetical protein
MKYEKNGGSAKMKQNSRSFMFDDVGVKVTEAAGSTYRLLRRGHVRHSDGGTELRLARSNLRTSRAAVPLRLGKTSSSRASDRILQDTMPH